MEGKESNSYKSINKLKLKKIFLFLFVSNAAAYRIDGIVIDTK